MSPPPGSQPPNDRTLSLAAGSLPEFTPEQVVDAAARAGFDHVGLTLQSDALHADRLRRLGRAVRGHGLSLLDVEVCWIPAGGRLTDDHRRLLDAAGGLGAANLLTVSDEPDPQRAGDALRQLCEWAAPHGLRVALEFLMITAVRTLDQALAVIDACGHPAAALLIDSLHLQRAGHSPAAVSTVPERLLSYAQICDGPAHCADEPAAYLRDALDLRSAPGEGELPLTDLLTVLPAHCPLSLEIRSRQYRERYPDAAARAAAIRQRTLAFFRPAAAPP